MRSASLRPLAWDFRRLRFSRNASLSRSRRESFTSAPVFPAPCLDRPSSSVRRTRLDRAGRHAAATPPPNIVCFVVPRRNRPWRLPQGRASQQFGAPDAGQGWLGTGSASGGLTALNWAVRRRHAPIFADFGPFPACPRACARGALVARTGRLVGGHLGRFPRYRACCRSSVVEHSIGNGEVDSSILSGSTIYPIGCIDFIGNSVLSATQKCHTEPWFP